MRRKMNAFITILMYLLVMMAVAFIVYMLAVAWDNSKPHPTPTAYPTVIVTVVRLTPTPTTGPTLTPTALPTFTPTLEPSPTLTLIPTFTAAPPTFTPTPEIIIETPVVKEPIDAVCLDYVPCVKHHSVKEIDYDRVYR